VLDRSEPASAQLISALVVHACVGAVERLDVSFAIFLEVTTKCDIVGKTVDTVGVGEHRVVAHRIDVHQAVGDEYPAVDREP